MTDTDKEVSLLTELVEAEMRNQRSFITAIPPAAELKYLEAVKMLQETRLDTKKIYLPTQFVKKEIKMIFPQLIGVNFSFILDFSATRTMTKAALIMSAYSLNDFASTSPNFNGIYEDVLDKVSCYWRNNIDSLSLGVPYFKRDQEVVINIFHPIIQKALGASCLRIEEQYPKGQMVVKVCHVAPIVNEKGILDFETELIYSPPDRVPVGRLNLRASLLDLVLSQS